MFSSEEDCHDKDALIRLNSACFDTPPLRVNVCVCVCEIRGYELRIKASFVETEPEVSSY